MNSLLLFRDQMRLWRPEGWRLLGIDVVRTSHTASYAIESLAAMWGRPRKAGSISVRRACQSDHSPEDCGRNSGSAASPLVSGVGRRRGGGRCGER